MVTIARPDDVRNQNRQRILAVVRRGAVVSRTDITQQTGLSAATVSAITSDLLQEGVLVPPQPTDARPAERSSGRGRPKVALVVNPDAAMVCSVYFHLNFISAAMVDYSGETIGTFTVQIATNDITAQQIRKALIECIEGSLMESGRDRKNLRRIALGVQGVTDVGGGTVLWTPISPERDIPIKSWLEEEFGVPTQLANDCDMIARALNWREPEKYGENFAAVLLAHGVGMGLFLRGGIINGTHSSGFEFGHMNYMPGGALCRCGNRGCIEAYAGDYAISRRSKGLPEITPPSGVLEDIGIGAISEAAHAGDRNAIAAIQDAGTAIGTGFASLFALVDAFPIVLVGRGAALFDLMEPSIRKALEGAPGGVVDARVELECYLDEEQLVREGCAITALLIQDIELAKRKHSGGVAEC